MENPEEILHSLEEFSKLKPKDIPRELEEYLCFVAKTGDPVYQWTIVKSLFKEKLISVITDFYESCPSIDLPPCPNVEVFNYETMKSFILEKLDTFVAAPFTVQRISELLTTPRKEYNRIDKYMRALEKNILVVSTTEPLNRRAAGNGEGIVNGLESEHISEANNSNDINVEEMDDNPVWSRITNDSVSYIKPSNLGAEVEVEAADQSDFISVARTDPIAVIDSVITCRPDNQTFVSIEPVVLDNCVREESATDADITVTITAIPAAVQKRRDSIEPIVSSAEEENNEMLSAVEIEVPNVKEDNEMVSSPPFEIVTSDAEHVEVIALVETTESLPSEAEASIIEVSDIPIISIIPEISTNLEETENSQCIEEESNSLIQIPVISEITSGLNTDIDAEASINSPILGIQDDSNSDDSSILNEPSDVVEVSTSTPEAATSVDTHISFENTSAITKETTVSSTDDINSDVVDLKCSQIREESSSQEESSTESVDNTSEAEEKQMGEVHMSDVQEFASSSTISEGMDIHIEEETCQEAPTMFNR